VIVRTHDVGGNIAPDDAAEQAVLAHGHPRSAEGPGPPADPAVPRPFSSG
jgi:hypothetical protein